MSELAAIIQSMKDDLNGIYPLPKLKREVITRHLVPRKMSYGEFKQDIMIPMLLVGTVGCFIKLVL
jgi:hypothetical protein